MAGNYRQLPRRNGRAQSQFICLGNAVRPFEQVIEDVCIQIREHKVIVSCFRGFRTQAKGERRAPRSSSIRRSHYHPSGPEIIFWDW